MSALDPDFISAMRPVSSAIQEPVGHAFVIQLEPDSVAGERINVGVCVVTVQEERLVRFVTDFSRLEALYGADMVALLKTLVDLARVAALSGERLTGGSVLFGMPQPFFNRVPSHYLEQLFERVVPAGRALASQKILVPMQL